MLPRPALLLALALVAPGRAAAQDVSCSVRVGAHLIRAPSAPRAPRFSPVPIPPEGRALARPRVRRRAHLEFVPPTPGSRLYELVDAEFWLGERCGIPEDAYEELCVGRCTVDLAPGRHALFLRRAAARGAIRWVELTGRHRLSAEVEDRSGLRHVGIGVLGFAVVVAIAAAVAAVEVHDTNGDRAPLLGGLGGTAVAASMVGVSLLALRDATSLRFE